MNTQCIEVSLDDSPLDVLKGCSCLLGSLNESFNEDHYSNHAIKIIADVIRDAVSRLDDEQQSVKK